MRARRMKNDRMVLHFRHRLKFGPRRDAARHEMIPARLEIRSRAVTLRGIE
jgi:hypothetical protein